MAHAVNVLEIEPMGNAVFRVTGRLDVTSAKPKVAVHTGAQWSTIATARPGDLKRASQAGMLSVRTRRSALMEQVSAGLTELLKAI